MDKELPYTAYETAIVVERLIKAMEREAATRARLVAERTAELLSAMLQGPAR